MQRTGAMQAPANLPRKLFPAVLLLCLPVSGCGTTCVSGFWNGSTSGVNFSNTSCPLIKATGTVIVQMSTASAPPTAAATFPLPLASPLASPGPSPGALPENVQHIFVTLRGIEAHPGAVADEDSPAWQELAPALATHPAQLDLLTPSDSLATTGDSQSLAQPATASDSATIPADEYRQLRLRLVPRNPSPDEPIPASNACGNVGWNCIVFADRSARPLEFAPSEFATSEFSIAPSLQQVGFITATVRPSGSDAAPEFRIPLEPATENLFRVLPDEAIQLSIEFDPASSVYFASNAAVRLVPVFRVVSRTPSPAANRPRDRFQSDFPLRAHIFLLHPLFSRFCDFPPWDHHP